ncbi:MAG: 3-isopropylmalate dehydrogenase [Candidatus Altiarchaeales archaeon]|nr:3-isopropylmalate dehydrogenase [Candidatus Altiarchaeales archaeon]
MTSYDVAVIKGDGIGPEIIDEGVKVINAVSELNGFDVNWVEFPHGADHYLENNVLMPEEDLREIGKNQAIYLGALGDPRCEPGVLEKGILLKTRFYFDQYVNLRPVKLLEGVECPLKNKGPKDIDFVVVRENTEDFYVGIGNRVSPGKTRQELEVLRSLYNIKFGLDIECDKSEVAYQIGVLSREGSERVIRYAFELARKQGHERLCAVDKANVLSHVYNFWRQIVEEVSTDYSDVTHEYNFVDAITMWFVKNPEWYQTVVTPNMFGDIITDLGAMIQGGLGLAPGGNINPEGVSMFEPIHGSAPKYKGQNRANPLATIWAGALLVEELGEEESAEKIISAIGSVLAEGNVRSKDLGGSASTSQMGAAVVAKIKELHG